MSIKEAINLKTKVLLNGHMIKLHILGQDTKNPVIIFVHGGPGIPNRQAVIEKLKDWTEDFTIVAYDQRGTGGSYKGTKVEDLSVETMIEDLSALCDYVIETLKVEKVNLLCGSWGTRIGIPFILKYPNKVEAYIGSGQMVNGPKGEMLSYEFTYQKALEADDQESLEILKSVGPPEKGCYKPKRRGLFLQRKVLQKYGGSTLKPPKKALQAMVKPLLCAKQLSIADKYGIIKGYGMSMDALWEKMIDFDFENPPPTFSVPIYIIQGRHDFTTPSPLVEPWFNKISAPVKKLFWLENSAHGPLGEEYEEYTKIVKELLLKEG